MLRARPEASVRVSERLGLRATISSAVVLKCAANASTVSPVWVT